ncbi:hypothetical protein GLOIN_2v1761545 [Rhizophagus clarus]|uniref:F-box domain-containing protein n=1 Tax=Rhizophagus clarus TaxID=94130 RepID=A0A8H3KVZ9_9GLOM|nr:hypothetical protein GLOIN_2v1761545 [Rhizophagus clarus]
MSKLNKDIIYLILQELQEDKKSLYSCISVDKTWCEIIIPILWNNPWKYLKIKNYKALFNITKQPSTKILSSFVNHLSWDCLDNLSFPLLKSLKARSVPIEVLTNIISNTFGYLDEIKIDRTIHNWIDYFLIIGPMLLQTVQYRRYGNEHFNFIESYKTKGIVEKYDNFLNDDICEVFKWV